MLTFHGKQELKDQRIAQVRAHRLADQLVKGQYWQDGKGCAVGCTIHGSDHFAYETELGIPFELAWLEDSFFERLSNGKAMMWPERFLQAIPVGVDLRATHINKRLALAWLTDETRGEIVLLKNAESKMLAEDLAEFLRKGIAQNSPTEPPPGLRDRAYLADRAYRADRAYLAYLADRAYRAYLADLAYRAYLADLTYLADRADFAYLADLAYLTDHAYLTDLAYRADRADRTYLADHAYLTDLAYRADRAEIFLEVLAAAAPSTPTPPAAMRGRNR